MKGEMGIRQKIILMLAGILGAVILVILGVVTAVIFHTGLGGEKRENLQMAERAWMAVSNDILRLDTTASDYAGWDDTYKFARDGNEKYVSDNLTAATFAKNSFDYVLLVNESGRVLVARGYESTNETPRALPGDLLRRALSDERLCRQTNEATGTRGIVAVGGGVWMAASRPVLSSQFTGPSRGALILFRRMVPEMDDDISRRMLAPVRLNAWSSGALSEKERVLAEEMASKGVFCASRVNGLRVSSGYAMARDVDGSPALLIRVDSDRANWRHTVAGSHMLAVAVLLMGLAACITVYVAMDRMILRRIYSLGAFMERVQDVDGADAKIEVRGNDQISILEEKLNDLLIRLRNTVAKQIETERRAAYNLRAVNERLEKALHELEENREFMTQQAKLTVMGQMAGGVAHEFNNLLMPILGMTDYLLSNPDVLESKEEARETLGSILQAATDARDVVRRLSEVFHNMNNASVGRVRVDEMLKKAIELTRFRWKNHADSAGISIRVGVEAAEDARHITGDEAMLRQAVMNLVINAVDALPQGGDVAVSAARIGEEIAISVKDNGTGMTEEARERCLEPFYTTKGVKGLGLGLAVVQRAVNTHRGRLSVESKPGVGTTFTMYIPVDWQSDGAPGSAAAGVETNVPSGMRILLVDDNSGVVDLLGRMLRIDGHTVTGAASAAMAMELVKSGDFDVVITDHAMAGMSGIQMARELRENFPRLPILLLTGFADSLTEDDLGEGVIDALLSKPVTIDELRSAILRAVAVRRSAGESRGWLY